MAFVIKNMNMYFKKINDYSTLKGYLDKKHPMHTSVFKSEQREAMTFKTYGAARKFMKEHGVTGNVVEVAAAPKPFKINKMDGNIGHNRMDARYDSILLKTRDDIEEMISNSENNFKHMARDILQVRTVTLNIFLRNPYEIGWQTRKKIMDRLESYFEGAGIK